MLHRVSGSYLPIVELQVMDRYAKLTVGAATATIFLEVDVVRFYGFILVSPRTNSEISTGKIPNDIRNVLP